MATGTGHLLMKLNACLPITLPAAVAYTVITVAGCSSPYPPPSEVLAKGWRCTANDDQGNLWFYSDPRKDVASVRATEKCKANSAAPFSCIVGSNACQQI